MFCSIEKQRFLFWLLCLLIVGCGQSQLPQSTAAKTETPAPKKNQLAVSRAAENNNVDFKNKVCDENLEKRVVVRGNAQDSDLGAVLKGEDSTVLIDKLERWPNNYGQDNADIGAEGILGKNRQDNQYVLKNPYWIPVHPRIEARDPLPIDSTHRTILPLASIAKYLEPGEAYFSPSDTEIQAANAKLMETLANEFNADPPQNEYQQNRYERLRSVVTRLRYHWVQYWGVVRENGQKVVICHLFHIGMPPYRSMDQNLLRQWERKLIVTFRASPRGGPRSFTFNLSSKSGRLRL